MNINFLICDGSRGQGVSEEFKATIAAINLGLKLPKDQTYQSEPIVHPDDLEGLRYQVIQLQNRALPYLTPDQITAMVNDTFLRANGWCTDKEPEIDLTPVPVAVPEWTRLDAIAAYGTAAAAAICAGLAVVHYVMHWF